MDLTRYKRMIFSFEDQVKALEKIGYEVRKETEVIDDDPFLNGSYVTYRVYYKGSEVAPWAGSGSRRVDWVFNQELQRRMLNLFVG
jgi:hypothetical protein